jgi:hypothetical protein
MDHELYAFDLDLCGDVNGTGTVTSADGYQILNHMGDPIGFPITSCWAANVNGDGVLTSADGYHLLNHFGDPITFPLTCAPCVDVAIPEPKEKSSE